MHTSTMTTDAVGSPEPIVVPGLPGVTGGFRKVTIREQNSQGTVGFNIYAPYELSTAVQYQPGEYCVFERREGAMFQPGETIGYIAAASDSLTMSILAE